jgi:putative transposase
MVESLERRFGLAGRLPVEIEWLSDNGSPYTARETRAGPRHRPRLMHDPVREPAIEQSNGMAEAFVKTFKRDYDRVNPLPDAVRVLAPTRQLVRALQRRPSDRKCGRRCASTA